MSKNYPHDCLIVVADGTQAQLYRNSASDGSLVLKKVGELEPSSLDDDGPAGNRPVESSWQETDEATFAKQLAHHLNQAAHGNRFDQLVLVADPQTLGQIRPSLDKAVNDRLLSEHAKTLTTANDADIVRSLTS
ncbi:host attachment family protein [Granulosicoccus sp. 3-233]|uniref:host attachment family protein n=1 Tax=Granulosicoccus sp. 3-233 TaxID=3417969 RepID=UPI003D355D9A